MASRRTTTVHYDVAKIVRHIVIGIVLLVALLSGTADGLVLGLARLFIH